MKPWLVVPIYDHGSTIAGVIDSLAYLSLPCIVVDDGSGAETQRVLQEIAERCDWVEVERLDRNGGKGVALQAAYRLAAQRGATHVVQLDADGQHDAADLPRLLEAAKTQPEALILGAPTFDDSIPWVRLHGRKLSQWIVWLQTLSTCIRDPLCGFRCIPLAPTVALLDRVHLGGRMDFDPELAVRLVRSGVPVVNVPVRVSYPVDGVSHFRMVEDNLVIARTYVRLALGLPWRRRSSSRERSA